MKTLRRHWGRYLICIVVMGLVALGSGPQKVYAACQNVTSPDWRCGSNVRSDTCTSNAGGGSTGTSFYNCTNEWVSSDPRDGTQKCCYAHVWQCDTSCGPGGGANVNYT